MNILILNAHSGVNLGDAAIMRGTVESIKQAFPGANVTVAANDPESWKNFYQISVVSSLCTWVADCRFGRWRQGIIRMPFYLAVLVLLASLFRLLGRETYLSNREKRRLLKAFYEADLVFSFGGGYIYAHRAISPGFYSKLIPLAFALALGKKVYLLPQSVGPIDGAVQRWAAKQVIKRTEFVMLREKVSQDFVTSTLGISGAKTAVFPDCAFAMPDDVASSILDEIGESEDLSVGITMLNWGSNNPVFTAQADYEQVILDVALWLAKERNAHIYLFVQCYGPGPEQDDRHVTARMYSRILNLTGEVTLLDTFTSPEGIKAALKKMDLVIATRMHTAILSLLNNIPAVLIGYQHKSEGLMGSLKLEKYYCSIEDITSEKLAAMVDDLLMNREAVTKQIVEQMSQTKALTRSWADRIEL